MFSFFFFFGFLDQNIVENEICFGLEHHSLFFQWLEIAEIWLRQAICRLPQWYSEVSSNSMRQATRYLLFFSKTLRGGQCPLIKNLKIIIKLLCVGCFRPARPGFLLKAYALWANQARALDPFSFFLWFFSPNFTHHNWIYIFKIFLAYFFIILSFNILLIINWATWFVSVCIFIQSP